MASLAWYPVAGIESKTVSVKPLVAPLRKPTQAARVITDTRGDSVAIGRKRIQLKLAAISYSGTHADGDTAFRRAAFDMLHEAALEYVSELVGAPQAPIVDPGQAASAVARRAWLGETSTTDAVIVKLKLAACTYAATRHGRDGNTEFCRAGVELLCMASIRYVEALTGTGMAGVVDKTLALDNGK